MDIASILEEYLADISTLPGDLAFILDEIRIKDQKLLEAQRRIQQRDAPIQKYVQTNGASQEYNKEQQFYPKIRCDFQECISLQQEKTRLATMGLYLVTKHVTKLDNHVSILESEGALPPVTHEVDDSANMSTVSDAPLRQRRPTNDTSASRRTSRVEHSRTHSRSSSIPPPTKLPSPSNPPPVPAPSLTSSSPSSFSSKAPLPVPSESERESLEHNGARVSLKRNVQSPRHQRPPGDEGDETFCYCKKGSSGNMIGCDGDSCEIEWFHWDCVGLTEDPKGSWYCPQCKEKLKRSR